MKLTPITYSDAPWLVKICADPQTKHLEWPHQIKDEESACKAIEEFWKGEGKFGHFKLWWGVWVKDEMIGTIMFRLRDNGNTFGLPPYIAPAWRGKGYGTQAINAAFSMAKSIGYEQWAPRVENDNAPMLHLAQKLRDN